VEAVSPPNNTWWEQTLVELSCLDDDAQGERLSVLWEREVDARVLEASRWNHVANRGFDAPDKFSAYLKRHPLEPGHFDQPQAVSGSAPGGHSGDDVPA
jgi:hypothetical protein